ncbi:DUF6443 domain-containing protein [Zobellia laminariae]|uniref:DUF6443 domain-containing protein n=1 Tax=Zobellia laminariae TaxID=248906 RepID=UPI0012D9A73B|nr:hypothetical protein [Zobellia laminariae]
MKNIIIPILVLLCTSFAFGQVSPEEKQALQDFYNATGGPNWTSENDADTANDWDFSGPVTSSWKGVVVTGGKISHLHLARNGLVGNIPESIGDLLSIKSLLLSDNQLSGNIPAKIGQLLQLEGLYLSKNQLSGAIPESLGNLINLQSLLLSDNRLEGGIPVSLGQLTSLITLWLSSNNLTGNIPVNLGNLTQLNMLLLGYNQLSGAIPEELGQLVSIKTLNLRDNSLTGTIPDVLFNLKNIEQLHLSNNLFVGGLSTNIGNMIGLRYLDLSKNQLTGSIPINFGDLSNLESLNLAENQLSGSIPINLGNLSNLSVLNLAENQLSGSIPQSITNLSNLSNLNLSKNELTGKIPNNMGNLLNISVITLSYNELSGNIPEEIFTLPSLYILWLDNNNLVGSIPNSIGSATNLYYLWLNGNQLTGTIPLEIESLTNLSHLWLNDNQLTGFIPSNIGSLSNLKSLNLNFNNLSGPIPESIGLLSKLEGLQLQENNLSGSLPESMRQLSKMKTMRLSSNKLSGVIPTGFANMTDLIWLDLNGNMFLGDIPDFTSLDNLSNLGLDDNVFQFGDFENEYLDYLSLPFFYMNSQSNVNETSTLSISVGAPLTLQTTVSGTQNHYQWLKDGNPIAGAPDSSQFTISTAQLSDSGVYTCKVTSDIVTGLTIDRNPITVNVSNEGGPTTPIDYNYTGDNYVYSRTYQKPLTTIPNAKFENDDTYIQNITYFDGLGRPIQQNAIRQSPNDKKDIVTHIGYDGFGRQDKDWLPFHETQQGIGQFKTGDMKGATRAYYKTHQDYSTDFPSLNTEDTNPYSKKEFEPSPLNRVLKQAAPGEDWALNKGGEDHAIEFDYKSNATGEVRLFTVDLSGGTDNPILATTTNYTENELYKTITKDENHSGSTKNHTTEEFKDKQGRVVLKRTYADTPAIDLNNDGDTLDLGEQAQLQAPHDTYYVYDDYGNLTYVLPPKMEATAANLATLITDLPELGYQYKYDYRNRLVEKKIPGKDWEYIVYNRLDQPVMTQDANMRRAHNSELSIDRWLFTKYDAFGRVAYTGMLENNNDRSYMVSIVEGADSNVPAQYETASQAPILVDGIDLYYTNDARPTGIIELYTVNYYDDYNFLASETNFNVPSSVFDAAVVNYNDQEPIKTKGLATGSKIKVLDQDSWITSVSGYDTKGRPVYTRSVNDYLETIDVVESKLDFVGKPDKVKTIHTRTVNNIATTIATIDNFTYDHVGRLLAQTQCIGDATLGDSCAASGTTTAIAVDLPLSGTINDTQAASNSITVTNATIIPDARLYITDATGGSGEAELIVLNTYDELGQLENKKVGGNANATNVVSSAGLQTVDYRYNVRGWLKTINNDQQDDNDLFNFNLRYNDPVGGTALFNGNISQSNWQTQGEDSSSKTYSYSYDALNRITGAVDNTGYFDLGTTTKPITYDKNGNIQQLLRMGHTVSMPDLSDNDQDDSDYGAMDDLSYVYENNQLQSVTDGGAGTGFLDGNVGSVDYVYDTNGNMISDANKGVTGITYNHLNLPTALTVNGNGNNGSIKYIYDATGAKLQKNVLKSTGNTTTDYAGNYIYENDKLAFFSQPEGTVSPKNINDYSAGFDYTYDYKDHLGNIRLSYIDADGNGSIDPANEIVKESNYYPFGLSHKGYNNNVSSLGNSVAKKYMFGGKESQDELGLGWYDVTARNYDPALGRWMNLDPLAEAMRRHSPYNYAFNNPIYFLDPDGMSPFSTHTDEDGNVLAVYDDGDLGVYTHENGTKVADIDSSHSNENTSAGGSRKGETLHTFSFVDGAELEEGNIVATGKIDFDSNWAQDKVQTVLDDSNGIVDYGLNAGNGEEFDIKLDAVKEGKAGGIYYGSQIKDGVYASARDAGNFAAGAKADNSIFSNSDIMYGYGAFNTGGNNAKNALFSIVSDLIIRISGGDKGLLQAPSYGEDKQSYLGINAGMKNSKWFD